MEEKFEEMVIEHKPKSSLHKRNDVVEFIRAFAMLWVASYHIWQLSWWRHSFNIFGKHFDITYFPTNGYLGVELFVFISGFGLFYSFAKRHFAGLEHPRMLPFVLKRAFKIYPSYLFAIIAAMIFFPDTYKIKTFADGLWHVLSHVTFIHNLFPSSFDSILGVLWMIGVIVQFYLIFPLICKAFLKRPVVTFTVVTLFGIAYRVIVKELWFSDIIKLYSQVPGFLDLFVFGMAAAYVVCNLKQFEKKLAKLKPIFTFLTAVAVVLFIARVFDADQKRFGENGIQVWQMFNRFWIGLILFFFTVTASFANRSPFKFLASKMDEFFSGLKEKSSNLFVKKLSGFMVFLSHRSLTLFVAAVSYNFYIWHQQIGRRMYEHNFLPTIYPNAPRDDVGWQILYTVMVYLISFAVATAITYLIEKPIMKLSRKWIKG